MSCTLKVTIASGRFLRIAWTANPPTVVDCIKTEEKGKTVNIPQGYYDYVYLYGNHVAINPNALCIDGKLYNLTNAMISYSTADAPTKAKFQEFFFTDIVGELDNSENEITLDKYFDSETLQKVLETSQIPPIVNAVISVSEESDINVRVKEQSDKLSFDIDFGDSVNGNGYKVSSRSQKLYW